MPAKTTKVFIVDDHPLVRDGLALLLGTERDLQLCGSAGSAQEAQKQIEKLQPDLIVLDLTLQDGLAFELIKTLKERFPKIRILVVSALEERLYAERALRCGAHGFVNKRECEAVLLNAVRELLAGQRHISEEIQQRLVDRALNGHPEVDEDPVSRLTDRELEIFHLIGEGTSTSEIAQRLHLSPHTIDSHREKIRHKLGVKNGNELRQVAMRWVIEHGS